jgi:hypothetical protein
MKVQIPWQEFILSGVKTINQAVYQDFALKFKQKRHAEV